MSKIEEIEQAVEKLPLKEFIRLASWIAQRKQRLETKGSVDQSALMIRDHSAFLSSYCPEDEGLYDDAAPG